MAKDFIFDKRSSDSNEPKTIGEIIDEVLRSNSRFAIAYRKYKEAMVDEAEGETDRLFERFHPDTHLSVDLKLMTRKPGRMPVNGCLPGVLARDGDDHFCFIENASEKKRVITRRNPRIYKGALINVIRQDDGSLYPSFNRPPYTESFTFRDFCLAAAEELFVLAGLVEN